MKAIKNFTPLFLITFMLCCTSKNITYQQVAKDFVIALDDYYRNPKSDNHDKLSKLTSHYTLQLIAIDMAQNKILSTNTLEYKLIRDSISADKMKAWVWYSNAADLNSNKTYKIQLRQSLSGWIVDQPLM